MSILENKMDFVLIASVSHANPNGDPLNGNMPRTTYDGFGEMSDVCLKRKIRNRLLDMGESIFVQSDDKNVDGFASLRERANSVPELKTEKNADKFAQIACENWLDVRSFGQVFAYKGDKGDTKGLSVGVRGPVSIHPAFSVDTVDITSTQITKSVNNETNEKGGKSSDTMGMKHRIDFGVYIIKGSINVQLAEKTGFSEEDAQKIKEALKTIFVNDCSSARPDGSMEVEKLYWWKHHSKLGQYSSAKVHNLVRVEKNPDVLQP
ncbi:MAG: type I-C CRISPR-associated protein Cas7/Csd2, partial [Oscillospiraceae bacterium]